MNDFITLIKMIKKFFPDTVCFGTHFLSKYWKMLYYTFLQETKCKYYMSKFECNSYEHGQFEFYSAEHGQFEFENCKFSLSQFAWTKHCWWSRNKFW